MISDDVVIATDDEVNPLSTITAVQDDFPLVTVEISRY